ncbi:MAG: hypothetical protein JW953_12585 [Anaerolineae bacterium]|nr:hypothetical protein [Anaerolineae bacterium]
MKLKKLWSISVVVTVLLVLVTVGTVMGQEPESSPPPAEGEGDFGAEAEIGIMAVPAKTMNYQGYLTDNSGSPLNGSYNMVFSLWDEEAAGAGNREWGDETHTGVSVSNGIFSVVLGETVPLDPYTDFDEQLYLEIVVNGTTLPRQTLRAVPYAMGLTSGARVMGQTDTTSQYGLYVENKNGRALYVDGVGDNIYGIYNTDVTYSDEGFAGRDTCVFAPTLNAVLPYLASGYHLSPQNGNYTAVVGEAGGGSGSVYIPLQVEVPYGREYVLDQVRVYYKVGGGASITWAGIMGMNFDNGGMLTIGSNSNTYSSATATSFAITPTNPYTITTTTAPTGITLSVNTPAGGDMIHLYGVRLQLDSSYEY